MRFCTSCQFTKPVEGGEMHRRGIVNRWICKTCLQRRSESRYKNHHEPSRPREMR
jgi:hypothetical protein